MRKSLNFVDQRSRVKGGRKYFRFPKPFPHHCDETEGESSTFRPIQMMRKDQVVGEQECFSASLGVDTGSGAKVIGAI